MISHKLSLTFLFIFIVSLLISIILVNFLFKKKNKNKYLFILYLTVLNTATLFIGLIPFILFIFYFLNKQRNKSEVPIERINLYKSFDGFPVVRRIFGEGSINKFIDNKKTSKNMSMKTLMFLSELKTQKSVKLVKEMLSYSDDEVRLLSFSIIQRLEKEISSKIYIKIGELNNDKNEIKNARIHKELAKLYWEIIYFNLSDNELRKFIILEVEKHIGSAIKILKDDPVIFEILGRIYLSRKNYKDARECFIKSISCGGSESKVVPYLAEISFILKDFKGVRELLSRIKHLKMDFLLSPVISLWEA